MSFLSRLFGKADVIEQDGHTIERFTTVIRGKLVQVNRHDRDDNQVTVAYNNQMVPRIMHLDDVEDSIKVNT